MKQIPILFSTSMVQAILEGRKTMTRRIVKGFMQSCMNDATNPKWWEGINGACKYQPGDIIWVRESCCWVMCDHAHDLLEGAKGSTQWVYKSSMHEDWMKYAKEKYGYKWKPSIHMPKEACRLFLKVKSVKVERLQDIIEQDAIAEGIQSHFESLFQEMRYRDYDKELQKGYGDPTVDYPTWRDPISSFKSLWQSINGKDSWAANPWVWVIEFERIEKPIDFK